MKTTQIFESAELTREEKQAYKERVENFINQLEGITIQSVDVCTTNGISIYAVVSKEGENNMDYFKKIRFSEHEAASRLRKATEIMFSLNIEENNINRVAFELGFKGYAYEAVEFKTRKLEVPFLSKGDNVISERITKKGNTMYTVERKEGIKFDYIKK